MNDFVEDRLTDQFPEISNVVNDYIININNIVLHYKRNYSGICNSSDH